MITDTAIFAQTIIVDSSRPCQAVVQLFTKYMYSVLYFSTLERTMLYTFDLTLDQLSQVTDLTPVRIIHVLSDSDTDHYITLVDCDSSMALWIMLL